MKWIILSLFSLNAWANLCKTPEGIRMDTVGSPYHYAYNQGNYGLCYAYAGVDLLRSHLGINTDLNILEAAISSKRNVEGGWPDEVISALVARGYACKNSSEYSSFFTANGANFIAEVEELLENFPFYYGNEVVDHAVSIVKGETKIQGPLYSYESGLKGYRSASEWMETASLHIENSKKNSPTQVFWKAKLDFFTQQAELHHKKYVEATKILEHQKDVKYLSTMEAAETVYFQAKKLQESLRWILTKHEIKKPVLSLYEIIRLLSNKDSYQRNIAAYDILGRLMGRSSCPVSERVSIPSNLVARNEYSSSKFVPKIQTLLNQKNPQATGLVIWPEVLTKDFNFQEGSSQHAVQIIGCRFKKNRTQYLIRNSWGGSCSSYSKKWECANGRLWVDEPVLMAATTQIFWIENIQ